jgi:2-(1,2-epoxy-1,2-dihydrophenyl)acetyl-CoA isomerase
VAVEYSLSGAVATLLIDRPQSRNSFDRKTLEEIGEVVGELRKGSARALVFGGKGSWFCSGADLSIIHGDQGVDTGKVMLDIMTNLMLAMRALPMPIIAAWEGPAVGAGAGLALVADLRVLGKSATLVTGHSRIGMTPDGGLSWYMTRALGGARTMSLMLRGATLEATTLQSLGLADLVVDDGRAHLEAAALAQELAVSVAPLAIVGLRNLIDGAHSSTLEAQLRAETRSVYELFETDDVREGMAAFLEHRRPNFSGR